jgi:hypothetical protein
MCKKVLITCCSGRTEHLNIFPLQFGTSYIDSFHGNELAEATPSHSRFVFLDLTPPQGVEGVRIDAVYVLPLYTPCRNFLGGVTIQLRSRTISRIRVPEATSG